MCGFQTINIWICVVDAYRFHWWDEKNAIFFSSFSEVVEGAASSSRSNLGTAISQSHPTHSRDYTAGRPLAAALPSCLLQLLIFTATWAVFSREEEDCWRNFYDDDYEEEVWRQGDEFMRIFMSCSRFARTTKITIMTMVFPNDDPRVGQNGPPK